MIFPVVAALFLYRMESGVRSDPCASKAASKELPSEEPQEPENQDRKPEVAARRIHRRHYDTKIIPRGHFLLA